MRANQLKAGAFLTYVTMGVAIVISLLYTPIMLRLLPQGEYGLYTVATSVIGYLSILSFGLNSSYVRFYFREKKQDEKNGVANLNGSFLIINVLISVLVIVAGIIVSANLPSFFAETFTKNEIIISRKLLSILLINLALSFPFSVFSSFATAQERFVMLKTVQLIRTVTSPFVSLIMLFSGFGSVGMVVATTVVNILCEVFILFYCFKKLNFSVAFKNIKISFFKDLFAFSFFVFLHSVSDQLNWSVNSIVLGKVSGTVAVAIYGLASQLNNYFKQFSTALSTIFAPRVNELVSNGADGKTITDLYIKVSRMQFMLISFVLTGFVFWGRFFVLRWGGNEYAESFVVALILMLAVAPDLFMHVGIQIRQAQNKHSIPAVVMLIIAIMNLFASIILTRHFGVVGAAFAALITSYLNAVFLVFYYKYALKLQMGRYLISILKILPATALSMIFGYILSSFYKVNSYSKLAVSILLYTLIYFVINYFVAMNKQERLLLFNYKNKLHSRK